MKKLLTALSFLMLTACVQPTTYTPEVTQEELAAEEIHQQQMADQIKAQGGAPKKWKQVPGMRKQLTRVAERIEAAGADMCRELGIQNDRDCYYYFTYKQDPALNAYADGEKVVVFTGMMNFVESDEELALILSHELAHNMLGHPESGGMNAMAGSLLGSLVDIMASSQGVNTQGAFSQIGGNAGVLTYSKDFEAEADYVGLYIMARAGYDIRSAPNLWRRMSLADPNGIYANTSHPSNPARTIALNKAVSEIEYKKKNGIILLPDFKPNT